MAFVKKTWKDRIAEFPTRRRLTKEDNTSELVTVAREEGTLSQEGDAFSAENMNDLENRIDAEFTALNGKLNIIASDKNESAHWTVYELLGMIHFSGWMTIPANTPAWTWLANFSGIPEDKKPTGSATITSNKVELQLSALGYIQTAVAVEYETHVYVEISW